MATSVLRASAAALVASFAAAQCYEKYQCIFHHDIANKEYSWDLHQLCKPAGGEYFINDTANNHITSFNICGNTSAICAPGYALYDTHGVAIQYTYDLINPVPECNPKAPTCVDYDLNIPTCCTEECTILGTEFFQFYLMDNTNPDGGVQLVHSGMPPATGETFTCPADPVTGLQLDRQLTVQIKCDRSVPSTNYAIDSMTEPTTCRYLISGRSAAACGVKGDPFDYQGYSDDPAHSFGFVVLGATIAVLITVLYTVGEGRGWWNPIKNWWGNLPFPSWLNWLKCGGGYKMSSGSSKYSSVGSSSATPISASAYGTA